MSETQRILAEATHTDAITDSKGRTLEVRKLSQRERMQAMRKWGSACNVDQWFVIALMTACVRTLDGRPIPTAQNADQIEATSDMLGQEGLDAVAGWFQKQSDADIEGEKEAAKN